MTLKEVTVSELKKISLFSTLKKPALEYLAKLARPRHCAAGQVLYQAGDRRDRLLIIRHGNLVVGTVIDDEELILSSFTDGDFLGEEIIFNPGGKHEHQIKAFEQAVEIIELKTYDLLKLIERYPESARALEQRMIHALHQRLLATDEKLVTMYSLGKLVSRQEFTAETVQSVLRLTAKSLRAEKALIASFNSGAGRIIIDKSLGYKPVLDQKQYSFKSDTVLSVVFHSQKPLLINNKKFGRQFALAPYCLNNFLAVPLIVGNDIIGALAIAGGAKHRAFDYNDEAFLLSIAKIIAPAIRGLQHIAYARSQEYMRRSFIDTISRA